ncbi:MAG: DUF2911 domain-containing protein, partial [Bacteroidota bacterium]
IGFTEIELRYGSPATKDRVIWGDLVPYDEVWRAGANWATTINFSEDVLIEGEALEAGEYALFIIPKKDQPWTIVFSKKAKQWGSFNYDPKEDALRVAVLPFAGPYTDQLSYQLESLGFEYGRLTLQWERIQLPITINTRYLDVLKDNLEQKIPTIDSNIRWVTYLQGAEYLVAEKRSLDLAEQWLIASEVQMKFAQTWNDQYYPKHYIEGNQHWVWAQWYALRGEYEKALTEVALLKEVKADYNYYDRNRQRKGIDAIVEKWKEAIKK